MILKILYLVSKDYHDTKMSRVRFHSMKAIGKINSVSYYGPGWEGWDENKPCQENIDAYEKKTNMEEGFDLVIGFKPLDMKGFKDITYPKCLRYNEMFDKDWTIKEIVRSGADIVICHHYNDYVEYATLFGKIKGPKPIHFDFIPHSAEKTIFKPNTDPKLYDVIIVGATNVQTMLGEHYPLRARMVKLIEQLPKKYKTKIITHAGGNHSDSYTDKYAKEFADVINSSKIVITDCGAPKSRFGKYIEIPACGTSIAGDVYEDVPGDIEMLKEFLIEINMEMDDYEILEKLVYYLENEEARLDKVEAGLLYASEYTHEKYAERFMEVMSDKI